VVLLYQMPKTKTSTMNRFFAIAYASFWATIFFVRIVEFIALLYNRYPAVTIDRTHIHHFATGFLLIIISMALAFFSEINDAFPAIIFGIGLGLVADEFLYWTLGRFNYWSYANCAGTLLIALGLLAAVYYTLGPDNHDNFEIPQDNTSDSKNLARPLISIVIPAHNEEQFLSETLRAIKTQTYKNFEVIVVDNNSTDATAQIAKAYGARVISESIKGVAAARQAGFMAAKGSIIASTDADTIVPHNWLSRISEKFESRPDIVAYGGLYSLYSGPLSARMAFPDIAYLAWCIHRLTSGSWSLPGSNMAVRADAFKSIGGFNLGKDVMEDMDISRRLAKIGSVVLDHGHLVKTSGRRYGSGFIKGLAPYAKATKAGKIIPKSFGVGFTAVREEKSTSYNLLFALVPAMLLLALFLMRAPAVAEVREMHDDTGQVQVLAQNAWYHHIHITNFLKKSPKTKDLSNAWKKHLSNI
jgi:glycosyltransferase involved in cell wall biosynthesis